MSRKSLPFALLSLIALGSPAWAETYFVDAAGGDDANPGTSWDQAWRTLSHAAASTAKGDTIEIAPGLYDPGHGESFPLDIGQRFLRGVEGPQATIVDGGGAGILFSVEPFSTVTTVEGLWLRNAGRCIDLDFFFFMVEEYPELHVRDSVLSDADDGVFGFLWTDWFDCGVSIEIERSLIERCDRAAAVEVVCDPNNPTYVPTGYGWVTCRDTLLRDNGVGLYGDAIQSAQIELLAEGCTIVDGGTAIAGWGFAAADVRGSILWGNDYDVLAPASVQYSNTEHQLHAGTGNLSVDPAFRDSAADDHGLSFVSPCVDAGDPALNAGLDLEGTPRPLDGDLDTLSRVDMGALELAPLTPLGEAKIGAPLVLELWAPPGGEGTLFWRRGATETPVATPYGEWLLGDHYFVHGTTGTGPGPPHLFRFDVPPDPSLVGQPLSFQALAPASTSWPPWALTNAVTLIVED